MTFTGSHGKTVAIDIPVTKRENGSVWLGMPALSRDGEVHDWATHHNVYDTVGATEKPLIRLERKSKILEINAGGYHFRGELKDNGDYIWSEELPK